MWLILGILIGAGFVFLINRPGIKLAWYDWVMIVLAVVLYLLAIANYSGSMAELEPRAARFMLVMFGLPGLVLTAIVGIRAWRARQQPMIPAKPSVEAS